MRTRFPDIRIVIQKLNNRWLARFSDKTGRVFEGDDPFIAARILIQNSPERGFCTEDFEPDPQSNRWNRLELRLVKPNRSQGGKPCPDCGGTGKYVGLDVVETCATCGGSGRR